MISINWSKEFNKNSFQIAKLEIWESSGLRVIGL